MQNVQNAAEIQQRVINLVEHYRTKVGKESKIAKDAKEYEQVFRYSVGLDYSDYVGKETYEDWRKHMMINEQLLGHFYVKVAGENAEQIILNELLPDVYDKTIFTEEEETFLTFHFKEMVNYIIKTPCDDLESLALSDDKDRLLLPNEVLELIKCYVKIPVGAKVYYPFAGFAQFTSLYNGCHFLFDEIEHYGQKEEYESWIPAWKKLALHANNVDAEFLKRDVVPHSFDAAVSFVPVIPKTWDSIRVKDDQGRNDEFEYSKGYDASSISKIHQMYNGLLEGGKMILITKSEYFWDKEGDSPLKPFWEHLIADNAIVEIIQLPSVMNWIGYRHHDGVILIAEKGRRTEHTTMMDVRAAFRESDKENSHELLDIDAIYAIENNHGKDPITGLRKMVQIPSSKLKANLLLPQMYVIEKPSKEEHPVPISTLCTIESTLVCDVKYDLPIDTPWITIKNLLELYQGPLDISKVENANCPNNPENWKYGDKAISKLWMGALQDDKPTWDDYRISQYRYCTFLDGNSDVVLYDCTPEHGARIAVVRATGKAYAVNPGILVFCPKGGFDAESLAALLRLPMVYRQLIAYQEYGLGNHLNEILVPTDKRIIHDVISRMIKEKEIVGNLEDSLYNIKKSVRMRKHALTQSLSSLEAMFYALNAYRERKDGHITDDDVISRVKGTTVRDAFEYLSKGLKGMMPVLEHIADVEYTFAKPEWIDPELFIEDCIARMEKGWLNFKPVITWEKGNNQAKTDGYAFTNTQPSQKVLALKKGQSIHQFLFPKDALEHIFKNIISNAQSWAFNDKSREDYQLKFSWHIGGEGKTLVIEIENNGTPIPEDRDTTSLLEYGVSTALHHDGHNGIGCNEIDDIMQRYDGKVEIVSSPQSTFTVKYVLTFNHIDDMGNKYKVIKPVDF